MSSHFTDKENQENIEKAARQIVNQMTLREKVREMHGRGMIRYGLSLFFSKTIRLVQAGGSKKYNIPPMIFADGPRGVSFAKGATAFPVTMARGASWDVELESRIGEAMAKEIRSIGGNYSGAVCMNVLRHPAWGRAQETYGEDPFHIGSMAVALVKGIQKHNVQACLKHFAANSMENNRFGGSINMDVRTLREIYLPHFKKAVNHGAASIMSAYNKLNEEYCGENRYLLHDILREEWGFKGYVTSDWMWGILNTVRGIKAGMNVEMPFGNYYSLRKIKAALKRNDITMQDIDELVLPVIQTKLLFASRNDPQDYPESLLGCPEHRQLALEAAEKSAVLLKNENNLLPLDKATIKTIAVIGSLANVKQTGDRGSSSVNPSYIITPLEGIKDECQKADIKVITAASNDTAALKSISEQADAVIIIAGTTSHDEGEYMGDGKIRDPENPEKQGLIVRSGKLALGGDRKYLHLHQPDIDLINSTIQHNQNVIVSLVAGAAVTVEGWHEQVPAIIQTFYNGMEGGKALSRIIFGEVNPSGKLPFTVPKQEKDLPPFNSYDSAVEYGYYHGYTLFDKEKVTPRFPFGFGLSYTSFKINDLQLENAAVVIGDTLNISCRVSNTGKRAGAEVVQLYIEFPDTKIDRPQKLLRGFQKITLQPGKDQLLFFAVPVNELAWYNPANKQWEVELTSYGVLIGNSSDNSNLQKLHFSVHE